MTPFGPFRPDAANRNSGFAGEALNVLPGSNSYRPWPGLSIQSLALPAGCRGAFLAKTSAGSAAIFAGTATKLYKFAGTGSPWTDVTRLVGGNYNCPTDEKWWFVQYGVNVVCGNGNDAPQLIDVDVGVNFAALGGSPPTARHGKIVGQQLLLADLSTGRRDWFISGYNDLTGWVRGSKDAENRGFADGGPIRAVTALERAGLMIQSDIVRRFVWAPTTVVLETYRVQDAQGTNSPDSVVSHAGTAYYYGIDGFVTTGADGSFGQIGTEWIDDWFKDNSNQTRLGAIVGALDPTRPRIFWLYPSPGNTSALLDRMLCYDPQLVGAPFGPWSHAEVNAEFIFNCAAPGYTLEGLSAISASIDALAAAGISSLDSQALLGGAPLLAAFDTSHKMAFFAGPNLAATAQTPLFQPIPGKRFACNGFRPETDALTASGRVAATERPQVAVNWGPSNTINATGRIPARKSGRLAQFEVTIPAGALWNDLMGVDFDENESEADLIADGER